MTRAERLSPDAPPHRESKAAADCSAATLPVNSHRWALLSFGVSAVREEPFCGLLNAASWLDTKRRQNTVDMNVTGAHEYRVWHNLPRGQRCAEHHISPHVGKPGVASTGLCRNNLLRGPQRPEPLFFAKSGLLSSRAPNQRGRD